MASATFALPDKNSRPGGRLLNSRAWQPRRYLLETAAGHEHHVICGLVIPLGIQGNIGGNRVGRTGAVRFAPAFGIGVPATESVAGSGQAVPAGQRNA